MEVKAATHAHVCPVCGQARECQIGADCIAPLHYECLDCFTTELGRAVAEYEYAPALKSLVVVIALGLAVWAGFIWVIVWG
jgi:hypothetical protein